MFLQSPSQLSVYDMQFVSVCTLFQVHNLDKVNAISETYCIAIFNNNS